MRIFIIFLSYKKKKKKKGKIENGLGSSQSLGVKNQGRREEMRRDPFQLQDPAQRAKLWDNKLKTLLTNEWVQAHVDGLADCLLTVSDYYGSTSPILI